MPAASKRVLLLAGLLAILAGCGPKERAGSPDAESRREPSFAEESLARLESQSSFRFRLEFRRSGEPIAVEGVIDGVYLFPDRRSLKGHLTFGEMREALDLVAAGDRQYEFNPETRRWEESPANGETDPFLLLKRTVGLGGFQYAGVDRVGGKRASLFEFEPSLAFLDPTMEKEAQGKMWVNESSGLPVKLSARTNDGTITMDIVISGFNSPVEVAIPVRRKFEATFAVEGQTIVGLSETCDILRDRMSKAGLRDVRIKSKAAEKLVLSFESESDLSEMIAKISEPGSLSVRTALWPEESVRLLTPEKVTEIYGAGANLSFEKGNVGNSLVLLGRIIENGDIQRSALEYDDYSRPVVALEISRQASSRLASATADHVGKPLGFSLDSQTIYAPIVRSALEGNRLIVGGFQSLLEAMCVSVMLNTGPLPLRLKLAGLDEVAK
jgi:hypothetical protein